MRPTPAETIEGVVRILRDTVAPAVTDPHARAQLQQVLVVLGQMEADDPPGRLADRNARRVEALHACRAWISAVPERARHFTPVVVAPAADPSFAGQQATHLALAQALETFLHELRVWRAANGGADSDDLFARLGTHLTGEDAS